MAAADRRVGHWRSRFTVWRMGLAAGVVALEQATETPIVWATGQYLGITQ